MTKRTALFILALAFVSLARSETLSVSKFGGLNSDASPLALDGQTPDSQNVLTDIDARIQPRPGYINASTNPATQMWQFPKSDGTKYAIIISSNNMLAATDGSNFATAVSTVPIDRTVAGTCLGDYFYFSDTSNGLKRWDGTTVSVASVTMTFDKLATYKSRLVGAGKSGNLRTIYLSKYLDGADWTSRTYPTDTDPTQLQVASALDEKITALYPLQDKLMVFTRLHVGGLSGTRRSNFIYRSYSETLGTTSPESVQDCDGRLTWLATNRQIWSFDGSGFANLSEDIDSIMSTIAQGDVASRSTTLNDYSLGTFDTTVYVDTASSPGTLETVYPDGFSCYRNGAPCSDPPYNVKQIWTTMKCTGSNGTVGLRPGYNQLQVTNDGGVDGRICAGTMEPLADFGPSGTTVQINVVSLNLDSSGNDQFMLVLSSMSYADINLTNPDGAYNHWYYSFVSTSALTAGIASCRNSKADAAVAITTAGVTFPFTFSLYLASTTFQASMNGVKINSGAHTMPHKPMYAYICSAKATAGAGGFTVDDFRVAPQTFTYTSKTIETGSNVNRWLPVSVAERDSDNLITYKFNASETTTFNASSWTDLGNTDVPTNSTDAYAAYRVLFNVTSTTHTNGAAHDAFTMSWIDGTDIKAASGYSNQRYWLAVSISSTSGNNKVLVYDRRGQWQRFSGINAACIGVYNSRLYFGNTYGLWLSESGYADNGTAISCYYKTNTFAPSGLDLYSKYNYLYVTTDYSPETLATIFQVNGIDSNYSMGSYAMNSKNGIQNFKLPFGTGEVVQGKYISFKWSVSSSNFWRILQGNTYYDRDIVPD